MGFYNFTIAAPLCLIGIGYWWKHKADFGLGQVAILNLLLLATYFSHFGPFVLLLFTLSFFSGVDLLISLLIGEMGSGENALVSLVICYRPILF